MEDLQKDKMGLDIGKVYSNLPVWEEKRILEAIHKSDTEKFRLLTRLMRIGIMLKNAKITKPYIESKKLILKSNPVFHETIYNH